MKFTSYRSNHSRLRWLNLAIILAMLFSLFPLDIPLPGPLPDLGAEEASASISAPAFVETQQTAGASPAITYGSSDDDFTGNSLEAGISPSAPEVNANALSVDDIIESSSSLAPSAIPSSLPFVYFAPFPEEQVKQSFDSIYQENSTSYVSVVYIMAAEENTVIVYDHWEDAYEPDITQPIQPATTTLVFGDGDISNGNADDYCANSRCSGDIVGAGDVLVLSPFQELTIPRDLTLTQIKFDGRDKFATNRPVANGRAFWPDFPGAAFAGASQFFTTDKFRNHFVMPIGQDLSTMSMQVFERVSAFIMSGSNQTQCTWNGIPLNPLNQGQGLHRANVQVGDNLLCDKPVQVHLITGDMDDTWESRTFLLYGRDDWDNSYYDPVASIQGPGDDALNYIYNPHSTDLYIWAETLSGTTAITTAIYVPSGGVARYTKPDSAVHLYSQDGRVFYAINANDAAGVDEGDHQMYDWGHALVPISLLTDQAVSGWAPGYDFSSGYTGPNGSPLWVTALADTTIYADFDQDGSADYTQAALRLQSFRIYDTGDDDQSAMRVYTLDGTLISVAWGTDHSTASSAKPSIDVGTAVLPYHEPGQPSLFKSVTLLTDNSSPSNGNYDPGDIARYTIVAGNPSGSPVTSAFVSDALPSGVTYVDNSTTLDGNSINDGDNEDGNPSSGFPLNPTWNGVSLPDPSLAPELLASGSSYVIEFDVTIDAGTEGQTFINTSTLTSDQATLNDTAIFDVPNKPASPVCGIDFSVGFTDNSGADVSFVQVEGNVYVTVADDERIHDNGIVESVQVTVTNLDDGDVENITLTETSVSSNTFRNTTGLPLSDSSGATLYDGTLNARPGHDLQVDYTNALWGLTCSHAIIVVGPSQVKPLYLTDPQNLDRIDPVATGDTTTISTTWDAGGLTFYQNPVMASDFAISAYTPVTVSVYVDSDPGTEVTATLSIDGIAFLTSSSPTYNAGAGTVTWTGAITDTTTVAAGQVISLTLKNSSTARVVRYDSSTYPSRVELPTNTVIRVNDFAIYDGPYPGGSEITQGTVGQTVFIRTTVSDPFGNADITAATLDIDGTKITLDPTDPTYIVASTDGTKTYEYPWLTPPPSTPTPDCRGGDLYPISITAAEGYETGPAAVSASASTEIFISCKDLRRPCAADFRDGLGGNIVTVYDAGDDVFMQVVDYDRIGDGAISVDLNSISYSLNETGANTGIFVGQDGTIAGGEALTLFYSDSGAPPGSDVCIVDIAAPPDTPDTPGISVRKTLITPADSNTASVGDQVTYEISVINTGNVTLDPVKVVDTFNPTYLQFAHVNPTQSSVASDTVTWDNVGPLDPGEHALLEISFVAVASTNGGTTTNTATATGTPPSGPSITGQDVTPVQIEGPSVSVTKATTDPSDRQAQVGELVTFQVVVTNNGDTRLRVVPLIDTYDFVCFSYDSASPAPDGKANGTLIWQDLTGTFNTNLHVGHSFTATVTLRTTAVCDPAVNIATVQGAIDEYNAPAQVVEDDDYVQTSQSHDFGDAPDSYGTTLLSNGAQHALALFQPLNLGAIPPDATTDGQPGLDANGDDLSLALDDEDAFTSLPQPFAGGSSYYLTVPVNNLTGVASTLYAWVDFDVDGVFEADEFATVAVPYAATSVNLIWAGVSITQETGATTYARLRLTTDVLTDDGTTQVDERSIGLASDGEVEDYVVETVKSVYTLTKELITASPVRPGEQISFTISISNPGDLGDPGIVFLPLRDEYDLAYMSYGYGGQYADPASYDNVNDGVINWTDLAVSRGAALEPGETLHIHIYFTAVEDTTLLPTGRTENTAIVQNALAENDIPVLYSQASADVEIIQPTGVRVERFEIAAQVQGVLVSWNTVSELDIVGFNVQRSSGGSTFETLNPELILAVAAGSDTGSAYTYLDNSALLDQTYQYQLELTMLDGSTQMYGLQELTVTAGNQTYLGFITKFTAGHVTIVSP